MGALERFLHEESSSLPVLLRAGLAHVQFETIHPFLMILNEGTER